MTEPIEQRINGWRIRAEDPVTDPEPESGRAPHPPENDDAAAGTESDGSPNDLGAQVQDQLKRLERLLVPGKSAARAVQGGILPAWRRVTRGESRLAVTVKPSVDSMAIITANADLWTASAGYNQDLGVAVAGTDPNVYPAGIVGWKESGGSAAYAPNAATIEALLPVKAGSSYSIRLQWKINRPAAGVSIYAGAGSGPAYSPTRLTVRLLSSGSSR